MPNQTTNYNLNKPLVNDPTDQDLWGGYLNDNMDTIDTTMKTNADAIAATIPTQTGNNGKFLTTNGSSVSWGTVTQYSLPSQSGNAGKFLTTNGSSESWGVVSVNYVSKDCGYSDVGSLCFCRNNSTTIDAGDTISGEYLTPISIKTGGTNDSSKTLTGTWRCLGNGYTGYSSLYQRIS